MTIADDLQARRSAGESIAAIAASTGESYAVVKRLTTPPGASRRLPPAEVLLELRAGGMANYEIARCYQVALSAVSMALKRAREAAASS